jgi:uncharacterized protein (TIGR04255 family)
VAGSPPTQSALQISQTSIEIVESTICLADATALVSKLDRVTARTGHCAIRADVIEGCAHAGTTAARQVDLLLHQVRQAHASRSRADSVPCGKQLESSMFRLAPAPSYHLDRAPLAQALAQVRFPIIAILESLAGIAPLQEALRGRFPYMEQKDTHEVGILIGPGGPSEPMTSSQKTWELTDDYGYRLVVQPDRATLSVGDSYSGIGDFGDVFGQVLGALQNYGVPRCDRLGVRYLSIAADDPGSPGQWQVWFRQELRGLVDIVETTSLRTSQTQLQLRTPATNEYADFPAAVQAIIRHGFAPRGSDLPGVPPIKLGSDAFFLDLDLFSNGQQAFDAAPIAAQFRKLHAEIDRFFYWALTDDGRDYFGLELRG